MLRAEIRPGAPADLLVLDRDRLSAELVEPDVPPLDLVLAKARQDYIQGLYVGGREVVRDGTMSDIRAAMPELRDALRSHYQGQFYCG